jgi:aspartate kinase
MKKANGNIIIQKYGGTSVESPERLKEVAERIVRKKEAGDHIVVVVSAMGNTTDELVELAHRVSPAPSRRELDMLLSVGERISMTLLSMAINDLGHRAISFTAMTSTPTPG